MQYRALGKCGAKVSAFGLGGWTTFGGSVREEGAAREILLAAREAGINFFDIADVYSDGEAERLMGKILGELPRHELVISSKLYFPMSEDINDRGLSRKHVMESIDRSLKRIGTEYLDVYFCHRFDDETPVEETARAMDDLVRRGKVLYWGTSEWTGAQLREVRKICDARNLYPPQVEQPQFSLLARGKFEGDVRPAAEEAGMGLVVWSPLGSGVLTGKYDAGLPKESRLAKIDWLRDRLLAPANLAKVREFKGTAEALGCTRAQLALAWAAAQPGVSSVLTGATSVEQLRENLAALELKLEDWSLQELDRIFPPAD